MYAELRGRHQDPSTGHTYNHIGSHFAERAGIFGSALWRDCFSSAVTNGYLRGPHTLLAHSAQVPRRLTLGANGGSTQKLLELAIFGRHPPTDALSLGSHAYLTLPNPGGNRGKPLCPGPAHPPGLGEQTNDFSLYCQSFSLGEPAGAKASLSAHSSLEICCISCTQSFSYIFHRTDVFPLPRVQ